MNMNRPIAEYASLYTLTIVVGREEYFFLLTVNCFQEKANNSILVERSVNYLPNKEVLTGQVKGHLGALEVCVHLYQFQCHNRIKCCLGSQHSKCLARALVRCVCTTYTE